MTWDAARIWYIYNAGMVHGPFTTEEMRQQVEPDALAWRQGLTSWQKISQNMVASQFDDQPDSDFLKKYINEEKTLKHGQVWYVVEKGIHSGPYSTKELAERLRKNEINKSLRVWTDGLSRWASLHEAYSLVDELGLIPRRFKRVPFVGELAIGQHTLTSLPRPVDLSLGGIGFTCSGTFKIGDTFEIQISSDLLPKKIKANVEVVFFNDEHIGLKFISLSTSDIESISYYINHFDTNKGSSAESA